MRIPAIKSMKKLIMVNAQPKFNEVIFENSSIRKVVRGRLAKAGSVL